MLIMICLMTSQILGKTSSTSVLVQGPFARTDSLEYSISFDSRLVRGTVSSVNCLITIYIYMFICALFQSV